ncbi:uncharacterized protein [Ptychodera flava]|uniref:uncharacterized protein isoform X2 n=1 Tax=Ptychodera flava TaxID=63121 RepID=UPI00396A3388
MKIIVISVLLSFAVCAQAGTITVASGTFSVVVPSAPITINEATATTVTFNVGLANSDATPVTLTSVELYLSDNADLAAAGAKVSAAIAVTNAPTTVPASATGAAGSGQTNGMRASVQALDADECPHYNRLCIKIVPDDDVACVTITTNCVEHTTTAAPSTSDAPDMTTQGDKNGAEFVQYSVSLMLILFLPTFLFRQN